MDYDSYRRHMIAVRTQVEKELRPLRESIEKSSGKWKLFEKEKSKSKST